MIHFRTYCFVALFVVALFVGVMGIGGSMLMEKDGSMHCLFNGASVCQMSDSEHIGKWQRLFQATIRSPLSALLTLVWISFTLSLQLSLFNRSLLNIWPKGRDPAIKLFNYLLRAFSQGILHSQIYA